MQNENSKFEDVKYGALAQLIANNQEEEKDRWKRFDKGFDEFKTRLGLDMGELKAYNVKQNGNIAHALSRINELEINEKTHMVHCPLNKKLRTIEDEHKSEEAVRKWVTKLFARIIAGLTVFWILFQIVIRIFDIAPK